MKSEVDMQNPLRGATASQGWPKRQVRRSTPAKTKTRHVTQETAVAGLTRLRAEREAVKVEASKLELQHAKGELIERKLVRKFIAERAKLERDSWLSWSSAESARLAPSLA